MNDDEHEATVELLKALNALMFVLIVFALLALEIFE